MWSNEELDRAFRQLAPSDAAEPAPHEQVPFPLDNWLKLESRLDAAATKRLVRRRLWQLVGIEAAVLVLGLLAWHFWPWRQPAAATDARVALAPAPATIAGRAGAVSAPRAVAPAASSTAPTVKAGSSSAASASIAKQPVEAGFLRADGASRTASASAAPAVALTGPTPMPAASLALGQPASSALAAAPRWRRRQALAAGPLVAGSRSSRHFFPRPMVRSFARPSEQASGAGRAAIAYAAAPGPKRRPRLTLATRPSAALTPTASKPELLSRAPAPELPTAPLAASPATAAAAEAQLPARRSYPASQLLPPPARVAALPDPPTPELPLAERPRRLLLTLVAAPDLNTVRFASVQRPAITYGLLAEYRLNRWLRLRAGALQTNKTYRARRDDYDWEYSPGALRYNFDWVNGSCQVLELPLALRQDWWQHPTHTVFTSVGLSSYLLRREHYSYDAVGSNGPFTWQKDLVNENRQFLSVLTLSFGYEHKVASRWSWQAEPYLKLPLAGLGYGKVQLVSGGVLLGLKYGL